MDTDERIQGLEEEVRYLREISEGTRRNTSWLLWLLIGIPLGVMFLGIAVSLLNYFLAS